MADTLQLTERCLLFRPAPEGLLLSLCRALDGQTPLAPALSRLLSAAVERGWQGDLWHCLLAQALAESENPFSLACERRRAQEDSLYALALQDMERWLPLFQLRHEDSAFNALRSFHHEGRTPDEGDAQVMALGRDLAACGSAEALLGRLCRHYEEAGVGMLGLGQVFRAEGEKLFPVSRRRGVKLEHLVGYEHQKRQLLTNTLAFLRGQSANNVLLYGDAGTGKSTCIQALGNEYAPRGLRIIELYKHQFHLIPAIMARIKHRNYRFILLLDDLSFEENEVEYKHLKSVMEGGGEARPENVLIYATSNRRNLVRETWRDRGDMEHDGDIHRSDTMEEKLSLAGRFGLQIYYPNPTFEEYQNIVAALAERSGTLAGLEREQLRALAATWQVRHGSRSGRSAQQFVSDLMSKTEE